MSNRAESFGMGASSRGALKDSDELDQRRYCCRDRGDIRGHTLKQRLLGHVKEYAQAGHRPRSAILRVFQGRRTPSVSHFFRVSGGSAPMTKRAKL